MADRSHIIEKVISKIWYYEEEAETMNTKEDISGG